MVAAVVIVILVFTSHTVQCPDSDPSCEASGNIDFQLIKVVS